MFKFVIFFFRNPRQIVPLSSSEPVLLFHQKGKPDYPQTADNVDVNPYGSITRVRF